MTNYVKEHNTKTTYSFLVGFISHYAMDVYLHPYVYHNVGIYDKEIPETHDLRGLHLKFERSVDLALIKKERGFPSRKLNLTKKYFPLKEAPNEVLNLMEHTLNQEFKIANGYAMYSRSAKTMYKTLKYLVTDRTGIKKLVYQFIDLFNKEHDLFMADLSLFKNTDKYDYLNDNNSEWHHPLTNELYYTSVEDLFNQAKAFALSIITKIDDYINEDKVINLDTVFTDLSFNSGMKCELGMDFKYLNIYNK